MLSAANAVTFIRIPCALGMLLAQPFSVLFWLCYVCAGLSDIFDGLIAKKLKQQSDFGAKLDSVSDIVFACAIAFFMIHNMRFPPWLWACAACTAITRISGYILGFIKYRTFSALHTFANKAAGAMIFMFPLLGMLLGITACGVLICAAAFVSALEELLITIYSDKLDRERRSLFF